MNVRCPPIAVAAKNCHIDGKRDAVREVRAAEEQERRADTTNGSTTLFSFA